MQTDSNDSYDVVSTNNDSKLSKFLIPRSQRRQFTIQFTCLTVLGWVVGGLVSIALEKIILESLLPTIAIEPQTGKTLVRFFGNIVFAVIFATDQAIVLYKYFSGWLWIVATSAGWLIATSIATVWIGYIASVAVSLGGTLSPEAIFVLGFLSTVAYILSGVWLGFCQWLVLKRRTTGVWWWNFLPSISFFLISVLMWLLSFIQNLIPEANRALILHWSGQGLTAVILGITPAIGLCRLKRIPQGKTRISANHSSSL
ncbi:MAG: hypothetical protein KME21_12555 [Desmonostoc vinosum HA7617-LM4]|jgi:hypothetical protein|nr:hypothetical protein [Desmonostoc vinosum HA7617-LM4]